MPITGTDADSLYPPGIEAQTHPVMKHLQVVLAGCALTLADVVPARVYLAYIEIDDASINAVTAADFAPGRWTAWTGVGVPRGPGGRSTSRRGAAGTSETPEGCGRALP